MPYRWYAVLEKVEAKMDESNDAATLAQVQAELERVGNEIRATHVPASYGARLFALRMHHRLLVERLQRLQKTVQGK